MMPDEMIYLFKPFVPKDAIEAVADVLRSRFIGQGPRVDEFERAFTERFHVEHPVAVNSGTAALETAYDLIGIKPGDEVITTPLTCNATNLMLLKRKAKIVWADILPETLCIDPIDVVAKITPKTKAIVQVHLGGIKAVVADMLDYPTRKIPIVSDAAQALGIFAGDYTCCSFQAIKHITTGDGGMLVVGGPMEAHQAKLMRWFGIDREKKVSNNWQAYKHRKMTFDIELLGEKRQMNDIAAAMGIVGLHHYPMIRIYRQELFRRYQKNLFGVDGIKVVDGPENTHWLCTVLVDRRDDFAKMLFEANVDTNPVQIRNDIYPIYGGKADLPVMDALEDKYTSLPLGMHVTPDEVDYICDRIKGGW